MSLFEERDGWRDQAFVTNTKVGQLGFLEARHRAHARVEDRIRRFLHVPARLTHGARRRRLRILESWPWAAAIVAVCANIAAIPKPA